MQDYLVVSDWEVCNLTALGKPVWLQVKPKLLTVVELIKADVKYHNLCSRLVKLASVFFLYVSHLEELENVFWQEIACESAVIE